ncbi:hypothetical protein EV122DRAFT_277577 [Schizophyllum commune]
MEKRQYTRNNASLPNDAEKGKLNDFVDVASRSMQYLKLQPSSCNDREPDSDYDDAQQGPALGQPKDMLDMYSTFELRTARKFEQYRPRSRPSSVVTFVDVPMPRKSVNALPSSPDVTDTGSSMILAASPFQAHHSLQLHQCTLVSAELNASVTG